MKKWLGAKGRAADPRPVPARIGKYEVVERIAAGGFGTVYKAWDPTIERHVAIKTCEVENKDTRARAFREARVTGKLQHPNITTVFDFGVDADVPFIVTELLSGRDLSDVIREKQEMPLAEKIRILTAVAAGLEHAHDRGFVHRDIKPANIRLLDNGDVKIMDFGIAKAIDSSTDITKTGITIGSSSYMAPEQILGDPLDGRTDIFSFGVVAYELLSYHRPFRHDALFRQLEMIVKDEPDPLPDLVPGLPAEVVAVVQRAMKKKPEERFPSATELREAMGGVVSREVPIRRSTVLVVDDDDELRRAVADVLEGAGYSVSSAANGQQALDLLAGEEVPCLVLLDLGMPVMDGWEFLAKRTAPAQRIPIVLLSGMGFIRDAPGIADFLTKPLQPARLLDCVARFCKA